MLAEDLTIPNFAQVLRARTVTLLQSLNTLAGPRVFDTRTVPVSAQDSPCLLVYIDDESLQWIGDAPRQYDATAKLTIVGYVSGAPSVDVETQTEQLSLEIRSLLNYVAFIAPPVQRVRAIDKKFSIKADADVFEGYAIYVFDMNWTEVFEPMLAPFSGSVPPGAYGAPLTETDLTVETATGEVLTGATIVFPLS
ncbi:MAG: hypothetical protein POH28_00470 [Acidocella sp.]|nr:hypothetical protein [Acidocella sp.]